MKQKIETLEAGRAIAALAVVFHHAYGSGVGYLGVDFFFVLSGFIIYHVNRGAKPTLEWVKRFARSRLRRVYVPYLPVGIAMAAAYTLLPELSHSTREWGWLPSLTLLPTSQQPALIVAWTLIHELIFYTIFCIAFVTGRPFLVFGLWALSIGIAAWLGPVGLAASYLLNPMNIEFLFGVAIAAAPRRRTGLLGAVALAAFALLGAEHRILFGFAIACLLLPVVQMESQGRIKVPAWLVYLGGASYSIYLIHQPVVTLAGRLIPYWPLVALAGVAAGLAYHHLYEIPALSRWRQVRPALQRLWLRPSR